MQSAFSVKVLRQLHTGRSGIVDVCSSCAIQKVARWTLPIESTPFKLSKARHSSTRNTVLDITPVETVKPINYQDKALKELSGLLSRASKIIDSETFQGSQDLISEDKAMAFDLDTIMNSLGYVDADVIVVANLPNDTLGLTVDHYNMLLKHLLWNYVDAPPQYLSHHSSVLPKYLPGTSIPSDILKIANSLEEDMSFMSLKPNPLTLSYLILAIPTTLKSSYPFGKSPNPNPLNPLPTPLSSTASPMPIRYPKQPP
ncbi:hypothetical protein BC829DRAFT_445638 [Chytridium lagenaria]|nr:hypothetical protein BC829DRAFT_445638 [Chytridium lagenaria]